MQLLLLLLVVYVMIFDFSQIRTGKWDEETQSLFCRDMDNPSLDLELAPDKYLQALK
jgi:hypothetical protein